ncbi:hypothetical protein O0I10_013130 [Lichtheimia ornata]|uniref:Reverse transcriptase domain-containing protein n=1 Tax=Lichtheimia ornata TaxID=688661 RepID=A0AAD7URJ6_9FUNG|nr:uncharacterized protein O0I10_013130 [Lichtheimia ornata]KAJ8651359.1 hypothetical protein O0I10_013130 [Lichtheimia ornata]
MSNGENEPTSSTPSTTDRDGDTSMTGNQAHDANNDTSKDSQGDAGSVSSGGNTTDMDSKNASKQQKSHKKKSRKDKKIKDQEPTTKENPKDVTRQLVDRYRAKLDKLIMMYNKALPTASTENLKGLQTDIANTRKLLTQFKDTYKEVYADEPETSGNTTTRNKSKAVDRMTAKDVPFFQLAGSATKDSSKPVYETVDHFLGRFRKIVEANTSDHINNQWAKWLSLAFPHHLDLWYETKLQGKDYPWNKVCKIVKKRFQAIDTELAKATEVYNMTMRPGEDVVEYGTRFRNAAREGGLDDNQGLAMRFLASLHHHIQDNVSVVWHAHHHKRKPKNLEEILRVAGRVSVKKRTLPAQSEPSSQRRKSSSSKAKYWCPHHDRYVEHRPEDCKKADTKNKSSSKDSTTTAEDRFKRGECVHCGGKWDKGHRCQEYRDAHKRKRDLKLSNLQLNTMTAETSPDMSHPADEALHDFDQDMADLDQLAAGKQLGNTQKHHESETLIRSPILIQNKRCLALIDSGAEISVVNKRLCDANNWSINHVDGKIWYAGSGDARPRIGTTAPLHISYNGHKPTFSFEVMNLAHDDVIIGKDLMPLIGIALTGLAFKWDDDDSISDSPSTLDMVEQEHNEPNNSPAGTPNERHDFERQIKPFMEANARIPKASYCNLEESVIELPTPGVHSSYHRQYPIPFSLRPAVDAAVKKWLEDGVIIRAPVNNAWNSPLTLAPKKDAQGNKTGMRPCLDPRHINRYLPDDKYPLPLIRDIFEALSGSKVFTTLDLTNAFHRFKIKAEDQHKTTFTHNGRQYMFQGCPFGLKPISSKFQRVMHRIFENMPFVQTFVDDIVIHSPDMHTHTQHVKQAIQALTDANLILNPAKCHMAQTHIYLLGFAISHKGISLDKRKLTNVLEWPIPKTGKDVQRFLGIVNYFQEHIPNVAAIRAPLDRLRNLDSLQDIWNDEHLQCFHKLKRTLEADVLLEYPDLSQPFFVATDASNYGIGATLFQRIDGKERYISFVAHALSPSERNYSATKRELLAVMFALRKFHQYLWGNPFTYILIIVLYAIYIHKR